MSQDSVKYGNTQKWNERTAWEVWWAEKRKCICIDRCIVETPYNTAPYITGSNIARLGHGSQKSWSILWIPIVKSAPVRVIFTWKSVPKKSITVARTSIWEHNGSRGMTPRGLTVQMLLSPSFDVGIDHVFASWAVVGRTTTHELGRPSLRTQRRAGRPHECVVARPTTAPDAKTWSISILPWSFRL